MPLDIYQPEADYASAEIAVSQQRCFRLAQLEDASFGNRSAPTSIPDSGTYPLCSLRPLHLRTMRPTPTERTRPEGAGEADGYPSLRVGLELDDLSILQAADALRPDLASLTGNYPSTDVVASTTRRPARADQAVTVTPGGYWDAFNGMWGFNTTTWSWREP